MPETDQSISSQRVLHKYKTSDWELDRRNQARFYGEKKGFRIEKNQ